MKFTVKWLMSRGKQSWKILGVGIRHAAVLPTNVLSAISDRGISLGWCNTMSFLKSLTISTPLLNSTRRRLSPSTICVHTVWDRSCSLSRLWRTSYNAHKIIRGVPTFKVPTVNRPRTAQISLRILSRKLHKDREVKETKLLPILHMVVWLISILARGNLRLKLNSHGRAHIQMNLNLERLYMICYMPSH
jgi:hypothetical protein